jgi:hypothetical protein
MDPIFTIIMLLFLCFATPLAFYLLFCLFKEPFNPKRESGLHTTPETLRLTRELYRSRYGTPDTFPEESLVSDR